MSAAFEFVQREREGDEPRDEAARPMPGRGTIAISVAFYVTMIFVLIALAIEPSRPPSAAAGLNLHADLVSPELQCASCETAEGKTVGNGLRSP